MAHERPPAGWRAVSLAAALFAITLNVLQPLAHAALMRDGGLEAAATMWGAFCQTPSVQDTAEGSAPSAGKVHECCLGLAQAPVLAELSSAFVLVEPTPAALQFIPAIDAFSTAGIRDGPSQPRAPPFHA